MVYENEVLHVAVEGGTIHAIENVQHGLATLISAYWVFHIQFPSSCLKTLSFLAGYMLKIPKIKLYPSVLRVINSCKLKTTFVMFFSKNRFCFVMVFRLIYFSLIYSGVYLNRCCRRIMLIICLQHCRFALRHK